MKQHKFTFDSIPPWDDNVSIPTQNRHGQSLSLGQHHVKGDPKSQWVESLPHWYNEVTGRATIHTDMYRATQHARGQIKCTERPTMHTDT